MKVAIISLYHSEASICLSKYIAKQDVEVDYFYLIDFIHKPKVVAGYQFEDQSKKIGLVRFSNKDIPELAKDTEGLPIHFGVLHYASWSKIPSLQKFTLRYAAWQIKKQKYDAINLIGQQCFGDVCMLEYLHNVLKGENLYHTCHEIGSHQNNILTTSYIDRLVKDGSKVILPSESTYNRYLSIPGTDENKTRCIPVGCLETLLLYRRDVNVDIKLDISKPTLLFFGQIHPYKGLKILAEAMTHLSDSHNKFNLIIAGKGDDPTLDYFKSLSNCQIINRYMANDEMMKLLSLSSIVVMPYSSASQSGIVLTAFMVGKPIIATRVGALEEVVCDKRNGILIDQDSKQLAEAILKTIDNKKLIESMSQEALKFGHGDIYDWNNIARESLNFFFSKI